jgi:D-alanyl-D-alanine carboxypeptidase
MMRLMLVFVLILPVQFANLRGATLPTISYGEAISALLKAYAQFLDRVEGNELVWKDGSRMPIDDGLGTKSFDALLEAPDIKDMFSMAYPIGQKGVPPGFNFDPGRIRFTPMFTKMYGDCEKENVLASATDVSWLPSKYGKKVKFTKINGAADALQAVSLELDRLPARFTQYLIPLGGTYNCRQIAGTDRLSAHSLGIAIDIAVGRSRYWLWTKPGADGRYPYVNETPWEIVQIFEKHGFIWGGKWYHYDTMHFEYRPEIIATSK